MAKKRTLLAPLAQVDGLPDWVLKMRRVAQEALSESDVTAIVKSQVEKAKQGDTQALKFVFDQLLGGNELKGATFIQNNYGTDDTGRPDKPTQARPGSKDKVELMAERFASGNGCFNPEDGSDVDLS